MQSCPGLMNCNAENPTAGKDSDICMESKRKHVFLQKGLIRCDIVGTNVASLKKSRINIVYPLNGEEKEKRDTRRLGTNVSHGVSVIYASLESNETK